MKVTGRTSTLVGTTLVNHSKVTVRSLYEGPLRLAMRRIMS